MNVRNIAWLAPFVGLSLLAACQASGPTASDGRAVDSGPLGNAAEGRADFTAHCAGCHASGDGVDLAYFSFPDSTIVRRAVAHVDTATALDIVAHVRTLSVGSVPRGTRLFQPGGVELPDDVSFAVALFGADAWPADLTSAGLAAIDPLQVRIAVPLPRWSEEGDNLDWMPDSALPAPVLDAGGGRARDAIARYRAAPSTGNLAAAVAAVRTATRRESEDEACGGPVTGLEACFEVRRWMSTLVAQHMIRTSDFAPLDPFLHADWWDVGNVARISLRRGVPLANATENWASWMLLGWMFAPGDHASVYLGNALLALDLPRHATFTTLRSQVARPAGSYAPYADVRNAARFAPAGWAFAATRLGYRDLLERLAAGDRPPAARLGDAREDVRAAWSIASRKIDPARAAELGTLRDALLAMLP